MEQKIVGFCRTTDFSFTNFVWVGSDSHVKLSKRIRSLEKQSSLISGVHYIIILLYGAEMGGVRKNW